MQYIIEASTGNVFWPISTNLNNEHDVTAPPLKFGELKDAVYHLVQLEQRGGNNSPRYDVKRLDSKYGTMGSLLTQEEQTQANKFKAEAKTARTFRTQPSRSAQLGL